jgi:non-structural maintenance of chromosomes element 4
MLFKFKVSWFWTVNNLESFFNTLSTQGTYFQIENILNMSPKEENEERRSRKRPAVMTETTQTDEERRELRSKQRALNRKLADSSSGMTEQMADVNSKVFDEVREQNNTLFKSVAYTREAVVDSENVTLISSTLQLQTQKLMSVPRYDANRLISTLRKQCSQDNGGFDWRRFGLGVGSCFNGRNTFRHCTNCIKFNIFNSLSVFYKQPTALPPDVSFLNGPIDVAYEPKVRKQREKRVVEEEAEEEAVTTVQQTKKNKDQDKLSAAEKHVSDIAKTLNKKSAQDLEMKVKLVEEKLGIDKDQWDKETIRNFNKEYKPSKVCAVKFLFNPHSFTQTVENVFGLSFLVKENKAKIGVRKPEECEGTDLKPGPWVESSDNNANGTENKTHKQAIIALSMRVSKHVCTS